MLLGVLKLKKGQAWKYTFLSLFEGYGAHIILLVMFVFCSLLSPAFFLLRIWKTF